MALLTQADLPTGVTATDGEIAAASAVVTAYCKRAEGLTYEVEADGSPCFMTDLQVGSPASLTLASTLSPGLGVTAQVTGFVTPDMVGEVVIAEAVDATKREALTITAVGGQTVSFARVKLAHAQGAALTPRLVISEQKSLPAKRPVTQVAKTPVARLVGGVGRYTYGRRSDQAVGVPESALLATMQVFSGLPVWQPFDPSEAIVDANGGIWVPPGLLTQAAFSEVKLSYVAGFPSGSVPQPLKAAVLSVLGYLQNFGELSGNLKSVTAGGTKLERFADQALDADTRGMLAPYVARVWG